MNDKRLQLNADLAEDIFEMQKKAQAVMDDFRVKQLPVIQEMIDMQKKWQASLRPMQEAVERARAACELVMGSAVKYVELAERWRKRRIIEKEAMIKSGWWLPPAMLDMPAAAIHEAIDAYRSGKHGAITRLFFTAFDSNDHDRLRAMVDDWKQNRFFRRWTNVIDQAQAAHIQKNYALSVPALLLAAEGIAKDYCVRKKVYEKGMRSKPDKKIKAAMKYSSSFKGDDLLADCLISAVENRIYDKTDNVKKSARGFRHFLNRHAVLHGISSTYGTKKNSLQCFMLLDALNLLS